MKRILIFFFTIFFLQSLVSQTIYLCDSTLVKKILDTYSNCDSYSDDSELTHMVSDLQTVNYLKINFKRSTAFLLELSSVNNLQKSKKFTVYQVRNGRPLCYQKWGIQPSTLDTLASLDLAISNIEPLAYGTLCFITDLLFPDSISARNPLKDYGTLEQLSDDVLQKDTCYKFRHFYDLQQDKAFIQELKSKNDNTLHQFSKKELKEEIFYWFRKKDFLLIKVEFYRKTTTYTSSYTWIIKPQINTPIPFSELQFNLPTEKNNK